MNEPIQNPSFHASKVPPRLMAEANLWPKQYSIFWPNMTHFLILLRFHQDRSSDQVS